MAGRPAFRLTANGVDITAKIGGRVKALDVIDEAGYESDTLEVNLTDHDLAHPVEIPPTGAELGVWLGYDNNLQRLGLFVADEIEVSGWPGEITIRARAAPYEASKGGKSDLQTQKTRSWAAGTTLGAMVAKIAAEHGMAPAVAASLASAALPHIDQTSESDVSFLVRVSRRFDAVVKPGDGKLIVAKRGESKAVSGQAMPAISLSARDCSRWSMNRSTRDTDGSVVAYYHDLGAAQRKSVTVGSGDPVRQLRHSFPDQLSAEKAAQGEMDKRLRRKNKLSLTMPGNPTLAAEAQLTLSGFRAGVPTAWLVTRVQHHFAPGVGYSCEIEAEQPKS